MSKAILTSTLHDPEGRLCDLILSQRKLLGQLFSSLIVVVSPNTHRDDVKQLRDSGFKVSKGAKTVVHTYKKALRLAIHKDVGYVFYCDFDRLLHWAKVYPDELARVASLNGQHDFLILGRTPRAFMGHPETQRKTEYIANLLGSRILGFKDTIDIISACWRMSTKLALILVETHCENSYGFYCEWPIQAWQLARKPGYLEVDGLEWETPDKYVKEIQKLGFQAWLLKFQTQEEWKKRCDILREGTTALLKLIYGLR